jgi:hypothetical protein
MNSFQEIDDIISLLNQERPVYPSNSSSLSTSSTDSSEMVLDNSDSELIELLNETKSSLSSSSSSSSSSTTFYSTGPLDTLSSYKSQCSSRSVRQSSVSTSTKVTDPTEEEIMNLLERQHSLVNQLNHENISLINQNKILKGQVNTTNSLLRNMKDSYASLLEQNKSLKEQLSISQVYNVAYLKQIKLSNKEISTMSIQQLIKSKPSVKH